jgi:hypothetical protein
MVVIPTCKSGDPANLTTTHLEIKTGFRYRPTTRRAVFDSAHDGLAFNGLLSGVCGLWGARGALRTWGL